MAEQLKRELFNAAPSQDSSKMNDGSRSVKSKPTLLNEMAATTGSEFLEKFINEGGEPKQGMVLM